MVYNSAKQQWPSEAQIARFKQFRIDKEEWDKNDNRTNTQKYRDKYCGDCIHHREPQENNSPSYTNCAITDRSVSFGTKCNCGRFYLRSH